MNIKLSKKQKAYIEGIIYIIAIIVVIFVKVYGSIYFSLIPLLVLLGIVGRVIFDRGVTTTIFGIITSLCIVYTKGSFSISENLLYSFIIGLDIAMGELLGDYLKKTYLIIKKRRENKKKLTKKQRKTYLVTATVFVITAFVNVYTNGSIYSYQKAYNSLQRYLSETYRNKENFEVISTKYSFGRYKGYNFNVLNKKEGIITKFTVYLKDLHFVNDEYKDIITTKNNTKNQKELLEFLVANSLNEKYSNLKISLECLESEKLEIILEKEVETLNEDQKEIFSKEVVSFLNDLTKFNGYEKVEDILLSIKEKDNEKNIAISNVYLEGYTKNLEENKEEPYVYIMKALSIEYIDGK